MYTSDIRKIFVSDEYCEKKELLIVLGVFDLESESEKQKGLQLHRKILQFKIFVNLPNCQGFESKIALFRILMPNLRLASFN